MEKWSTDGTQLWKQDVPLDGVTPWATELQIKPDGNLIGCTAAAQVYSHTPSGTLLWTRRYAAQGLTLSMQGGFDMVGADHLVGGAQWVRGSSGAPEERPFILFKLRLPPNP
jgi:hypothetical protein